MHFAFFNLNLFILIILLSEYMIQFVNLFVLFDNSTTLREEITVRIK